MCHGQQLVAGYIDEAPMEVNKRTKISKRWNICIFLNFETAYGLGLTSNNW